jgi:HK97 family phage major capsid protein
VIGEVLLRWAKASGIIVVSDELLRMSNPSVEAVTRHDMLRGMANFSDGQFVDPAVPDVANVSPASITNGVTAVPATGNTAEALRADLATLWSGFFAANQSVTTGVFIMSNRQAMRISLMRNALGPREFPDITPMGGVLEGFPVITSESVPDSSDGGIIIFANADDIFFSDDGPVTIDASREASLQMNTTPDEPTAAGTVMVSLWQRNLVALRAERYMNWKKRRPTAVGYIKDTNYGSGS